MIYILFDYNEEKWKLNQKMTKKLPKSITINWQEKIPKNLHAFIYSLDCLVNNS